jgi:hypothetical protein
MVVGKHCKEAIMGSKETKRAAYQAQIEQALRDGDVKKASAIRAQMYREVGEKIDPDDYD